MCGVDPTFEFLFTTLVFQKYFNFTLKLIHCRYPANVVLPSVPQFDINLSQKAMTYVKDYFSKAMGQSERNKFSKNHNTLKFFLI